MRKQFFIYVPSLVFKPYEDNLQIYDREHHTNPCTLPSFENLIISVSTNLQLSIEDTKKTLMALLKTTPGSFISIVLMVLAKHLDSLYEDHISKASKIFVFSTVDAKIHELDGNSIKKIAFKHFAAFRTKDEAIQAVKYMYAFKTYLLNGGK